MFKPHELMQAGSADVPLESDASEGLIPTSDNVRRSEVKFARVWQPTDLFGSKAPVGGFVSQSGSATSVKSFAIQDVDSLFLIGPRSTAPVATDVLQDAAQTDAPDAQGGGHHDGGEVQVNLVAEQAASHSQQALDEALSQGYANGMEDARAQLYEQIRAEIQSEVQASAQAQAQVDQALVDALEAAAQTMHQDPQQFYEPVKRLALHIAEQLVLGELRLDGAVIDRLVQRCVDDLAANELSAVVLELHSDDLHALHDLRKRAGLVEKNLPQLMANDALPPGSVRASANDAVVEDLITHRLATIARTLLMDEDRLRAQSAFSPERLASDRQGSLAVQDVPARMSHAEPEVHVTPEVHADVLDMEDGHV
jgi:flagellar biosynthesis/type III secretory pathway protein FliH